MNTNTSNIINNTSTVPNTPDTSTGTGNTTPDTNTECSHNKALEQYIATNQQALEALSTLDKQASSAINAIVSLSEGFEKNCEAIMDFFKSEEKDIMLDDGSFVPNIFKAYNKIKQDIEAFKQEIQTQSNDLSDKVNKVVNNKITELSSEVKNFIKHLESKDTYTKTEIDVFVKKLEDNIKDSSNTSIMIERPSFIKPSSNNYEGAFMFTPFTINVPFQVSDYTLRVQLSNSSTFDHIIKEGTIQNSDTLYMDLSPNTHYYARARYEAGFIESQYSESVSFSTANIAINAPIVNVECDDLGKAVIMPIIEGSEFTGNDIHTATTITVTECVSKTVVFNQRFNEALTRYQLSTPLKTNTSYYFEMQYHGVNGDSPIGQTMKITQNIFIKAPTLEIQTQGSLSVSTSEFECVNGEDTHEATSYVIKKGGVTLINEVSKTDLTQANFTLEPGDYILEVKHIGTLYKESTATTKRFTITLPKNAICPPSVLGDIHSRVTTTPYAFFYGERIQDNQKFDQARFEVYKGTNLTYILEFGQNIDFSGKGNGELSSQHLTTEAKRSLASGVNDAYKAFDNDTKTAISLTGKQSITLEYDKPVFMRRFNIVCTAGKEPAHLKLWGKTTLGWNLLYDNSYLDFNNGVGAVYDCLDNYNAYKTFKMEFVQHRKDNSSEVVSINYHTQVPEPITVELKDYLPKGEYQVRVAHKTSKLDFVFGAKHTKEIKERDGFLGFLERETDINLMRGINTGYEEDWRLKSIPTAVIDTKSFTPEYQKLKARTPFKDMKRYIVDMETGDKTLLNTTDSAEIIKLANQKPSLSVMTRIPKVYYIAGSITYNAKTFNLLCIGGEPFNITLDPSMLHGSTQHNSNITFTPMPQPHNYASGTVSNNNTKSVTINADLHPAFHGRLNVCDDLYLSSYLIKDGVYKGDYVCEAVTPVQHRANLARIAKGNAYKVSLMDFWTAQLLLMLANVAAQDEKVGRNTPGGYSAIPTASPLEWEILNSNHKHFFSILSCFTLCFVDGVIASSTYTGSGNYYYYPRWQVAHSDASFSNEANSEYTAVLTPDNYINAYNKLLGTNIPTSIYNNSSHTTAMTLRPDFDGGLTTRSYALTATVYARSVFRDWKSKTAS